MQKFILMIAILISMQAHAFFNPFALTNIFTPTQDTAKQSNDSNEEKQNPEQEQSLWQKGMSYFEQIKETAKQNYDDRKYKNSIDPHWQCEWRDWTVLLPAAQEVCSSIQSEAYGLGQQAYSKENGGEDLWRASCKAAKDKQAQNGVSNVLDFLTADGQLTTTELNNRQTQASAMCSCYHLENYKDKSANERPCVTRRELDSDNERMKSALIPYELTRMIMLMDSAEIDSATMNIGLHNEIDSAKAMTCHKDGKPFSYQNFFQSMDCSGADQSIIDHYLNQMDKSKMFASDIIRSNLDSSKDSLSIANLDSHFKAYRDKVYNDDIVVTKDNMDHGLFLYRPDLKKRFEQKAKENGQLQQLEFNLKFRDLITQTNEPFKKVWRTASTSSVQLMFFAQKPEEQSCSFDSNTGACAAGRFYRELYSLLGNDFLSENSQQRFWTHVAFRSHRNDFNIDENLDLKQQAQQLAQKVRTSVDQFIAIENSGNLELTNDKEADIYKIMGSAHPATMNLFIQKLPNESEKSYNLRLEKTNQLRGRYQQMIKNKIKEKIAEYNNSHDDKIQFPNDPKDLPNFLSQHEELLTQATNEALYEFGQIQISGMGDNLGNNQFFPEDSLCGKIEKAVNKVCRLSKSNTDAMGEYIQSGESEQSILQNLNKMQVKGSPIQMTPHYNKGSDPRPLAEQFSATYNKYACMGVLNKRTDNLSYRTSFSATPIGTGTDRIKERKTIIELAERGNTVDAFRIQNGQSITTTQGPSTSMSRFIEQYRGVATARTNRGRIGFDDFIGKDTTIDSFAREKLPPYRGQSNFPSNLASTNPNQSQAFQDFQQIDQEIDKQNKTFDQNIGNLSSAQLDSETQRLKSENQDLRNQINGLAQQIETLRNKRSESSNPIAQEKIDGLEDDLLNQLRELQKRNEGLLARIQKLEESKAKKLENQNQAVSGFSTSATHNPGPGSSATTRTSGRNPTAESNVNDNLTSATLTGGLAVTSAARPVGNGASSESQQNNLNSGIMVTTNNRGLYSLNSAEISDTYVNRVEKDAFEKYTPQALWDVIKMQDNASANPNLIMVDHGDGNGTLYRVSFQDNVPMAYIQISEPLPLIELKKMASGRKENLLTLNQVEKLSQTLAYNEDKKKLYRHPITVRRVAATNIDNSNQSATRRSPAAIAGFDDPDLQRAMQVLPENKRNLLFDFDRALSGLGLEIKEQ